MQRKFIELRKEIKEKDKEKERAVNNKSQSAWESRFKLKYNKREWRKTGKQPRW